MTQGNVIQGNFIGTTAPGTAALPNVVGVFVGCQQQHHRRDRRRRGQHDRRQQRDRGRHRPGSGNAIEGNAIFANCGLGIDLGDNGVTANTGTKNAALPNSGMNFPVFTSVSVSGTTLTVSGYVGTAPGQAAFAGARVEIFKSDNDPSGYGQGQTYLGFLTADASGNFSGSLTVSGLSVGDRITATATDTANDTSEFSPNAVIANGPVVNLDPDGRGITYNATYYANTPGVAVEDVTDATISDASSPTLVSLTVTIQNPHNGSNEVLRADTTGTLITASFSAAR